MHIDADFGTAPDASFAIVIVDDLRDGSRRVIHLTPGVAVVGLDMRDGTWSSYDEEVPQIITLAAPELPPLERLEPYVPARLQDWEIEPAQWQGTPPGPAMAARPGFRPSGQFFGRSWPPIRAPPGAGRGAAGDRPTGSRQRPPYD